MNSDADKLYFREEDYRAIIEDHDGRPHHFGKMDRPDRSATGYNPVCGDRYAVFICMDEDSIEEVRFEGFGCALSKASSSMRRRAGMVIARSTPARVACTPDFRNATQSASPSTT